MRVAAKLVMDDTALIIGGSIGIVEFDSLVEIGQGFRVLTDVGVGNAPFAVGLGVLRVFLQNLG